MSAHPVGDELVAELEPVVGRRARPPPGHRQGVVPARVRAVEPRAPTSRGLRGRAVGRPSSRRSTMSARTALVVNLLTEDNLPSYHRELVSPFGPRRRVGQLGGPLDRRGGPSRHRDPRLPARDPRRRPRRARARADGPHDARATTPATATLLHGLVYVTFQELATRISHRNTGTAHRRPVRRPAARRGSPPTRTCTWSSTATSSPRRSSIAPDADDGGDHRRGRGASRCPATTIDGFARRSVQIAMAGIYDLRIHHDEVLNPVLRHWKVFELDDCRDRGREGPRRAGRVHDGPRCRGQPVRGAARRAPARERRPRQIDGGRADPPPRGPAAQCG